ncbi:unnamed protein product [Somion occarium]|uniref:Uncharacterized protein n=1 Tax=Somion occarium TaxID=3059160 RepID=A0ABP1D4P4_9APHY
MPFLFLAEDTGGSVLKVRVVAYALIGQVKQVDVRETKTDHLISCVCQLEDPLAFDSFCGHNKFHESYYGFGRERRQFVLTHSYHNISEPPSACNPRAERGETKPMRTHCSVLSLLAFHHVPLHGVLTDPNTAP